MGDKHEIVEAMARTIGGHGTVFYVWFEVARDYNHLEMHKVTRAGYETAARALEAGRTITLAEIENEVLP